MARRATGQVVERRTGRGVTFALRFRAYGRREYLTLGTDTEGWTRAKAEAELRLVLVQVERGTWQAPTPGHAEPVKRDPTFHEFSSEWLEARRGELRENTHADYEWQLTHHLLPACAASSCYPCSGTS